MGVARRFGVLALLVGLFVVAGCGPSGPKRNAVSGTVTYKGQPLKVGSISFFADGSEAPAGGAPIADGKYEIPAAVGLVAGNYKVSISATDSKTAAKEDEPPGVSFEPKETLPAEYNAKTKLKAEVKAGDKNEFNFDLK